MPGLTGRQAGNPLGSPNLGSAANAEHLARQVQSFLTRADELPDPSARELVQEILQSVLALYGRGLERILELIQTQEANGSRPIDLLLGDGLVRSLLLVHGLHPDELETRVQAALEKVRPYLQSHGGNVELVTVKDNDVLLRFVGTCKGCPSSLLTMQTAVRRTLEEECPDLTSIQLEDNPAPTPPAKCA